MNDVYPQNELSLEARCLLEVLKRHHRGRARARPREAVRGETFLELQARDPIMHGDKHGTMDQQLSDRYFRRLKLELLQYRSKEWPKGIPVCSADVGWWLGLNAKEGDEAAETLEKKAYALLVEAKMIRAAHDAKYGRQEKLFGEEANG